jgi:hypothetical protein
MSLESIAQLDLLTFDALLSSVMRVTYTQRTEQAWTAMVAAQGTQKSMEGWLKRWAKITKMDKETKKGLAEFLGEFGGGF